MEGWQSGINTCENDNLQNPSVYQVVDKKEFWNTYYSIKMLPFFEKKSLNLW